MREKIFCINTRWNRNKGSARGISVDKIYKRAGLDVTCTGLVITCAALAITTPILLDYKYKFQAEKENPEGHLRFRKQQCKYGTVNKYCPSLCKEE